MQKTLAAIPAYNEEVAIGSVVLRCRAYVDEVLVLDDGSEDRTADVARLAKATVVSHEINEGKGTTIQHALDYARTNGFDAVVLLDGDGQHDPAFIPDVLEPVLRGDADIVVGVRERSTSEMPRYRRMGQRILDVLTSVGTLDSITDSQSGFRALSRAAIESLVLEERAFGVESEMLIEAKERNLRVAEVPIRVRYDLDGSTKGPLSHGLSIVDHLLRIIAVRHPLLFFFVPGVIIFVIGLVLGYQTVEYWNSQGNFPAGKAMLAIVFLMLGGLAAFAGVILNVMPKAVIRSLNGGKKPKKYGT